MADTLPEVVEAWTLAFKASGQAVKEEIDLPRFHAAFRLVFPKLREWPAPADFLDALPSRPEQKRVAHCPPVSDEERAANLLKLRELSARLAAPLSVDPLSVPNERFRAAANERAKL